MAMLNLPPDRRKNRRWQKEFFAKEGLDLEGERLPSTRRNSLNIEALRRIPPRPLNPFVLSSVIDPEYGEWINRQMTITKIGDVRRTLLGIPKIGGALRRIGLQDRTPRAYFAYLCLMPLENVLLVRNGKELH